MTSSPSFTKSGVKIQCDTSLYPAPRQQAAWPIPTAQSTGAQQSMLTLALVALAGQAVSGVTITSAILPSATATWTLYVQSYQGSPTALPAPAAIPVTPVAGVISYTLTAPLAGATINCWLGSVDGIVATTYPLATITTPADPTQSTGALANSDKITLIQQWNQALQVQSSLDTQAAAVGVSHSALDAAMANLSAGLIAAGAPSGWATTWPDGTSIYAAGIVTSLNGWWAAIAAAQTALSNAIVQVPTTGVNQINSVNTLVPADQITLMMGYNQELGIQSILDASAAAVSVSHAAYDSAIAALVAFCSTVYGSSGWTTAWPSTATISYTGVMTSLNTYWAAITSARKTLETNILGTKLPSGGLAANSLLLNGYTQATAATASTLALRDTSGGLTASVFSGAGTGLTGMASSLVAGSASLLAGYAPNALAAASTIALRDAGGSLTAYEFISQDGYLKWLSSSGNASARNWTLGQTQVYGEIDLRISNAIGGDPVAAGTSVLVATASAASVPGSFYAGGSISSAGVTLSGSQGSNRILGTTSDLVLNAYGAHTLYLQWDSGSGGIQFGNGAGSSVGSVSSTGVMTLAAGLYAPTGTFSGGVTAAGFVTNLSAASQGSLTYSASAGLVLMAKTGSSSDFGLLSASGAAWAMQLPVGSSTPNFPNGMTATTGAFSAPITVTANDPATSRMNIINTASGGQSWGITAGKTGVTETGLTLYCNTTGIPNLWLDGYGNGTFSGTVGAPVFSSPYFIVNNGANLTNYWAGSGYATTLWTSNSAGAVYEFGILNAAQSKWILRIPSGGIYLEVIQPLICDSTLTAANGTGGLSGPALISTYAASAYSPDALANSGVYRVDAPAGLPGGNYGNLLVLRGQENTMAQLYFDLSNNMYVRSGNPSFIGGAGVWAGGSSTTGGWATVYTSANILSSAAGLAATWAMKNSPNVVTTDAQMNALTGVVTNSYCWVTSDTTAGPTGTLYQWTGSAWINAGAPVIVAGSITAGMMSAGSIGCQVLAAGTLCAGVNIQSQAYTPSLGNGGICYGWNISASPFITQLSGTLPASSFLAGNQYQIVTTGTGTGSTTVGNIMTATANGAASATGTGFQVCSTTMMEIGSNIAVNGWLMGDLTARACGAINAPGSMSTAWPNPLTVGASVASTAVIAGNSYQITSIGTTNWTLCGAPNNQLGTVFFCTGTSAGTGTCVQCPTARIFYQGNDNPTVAGGTPDITCLVIKETSPVGYASGATGWRISWTLQPKLASPGFPALGIPGYSSNLDAMRYARVTVFNSSAAAGEQFSMPLTDRLYANVGNDTDPNNGMTGDFIYWHNGQSLSWNGSNLFSGYLLVTIYNAFGASQQLFYKSPGAMGSSTAGSTAIAATTAGVAGYTVQIAYLGTTNWQLMGAPAGAVVGTVFTATQSDTHAGTGTLFLCFTAQIDNVPVGACSGGTCTITAAGVLTLVTAPTTGSFQIGQAQVCGSAIPLGTYTQYLISGTLGMAGSTYQLSAACTTVSSATSFTGSKTLVVGNTYLISSVGTTNWTALGALGTPAPGTVFSATVAGAVTGTGTCLAMTSPPAGAAIVCTTMTLGYWYSIVSLGTTTSAQWNTAGAAGATPGIGTSFQCIAEGVGTGTVVQVAAPPVTQGGNTHNGAAGGGGAGGGGGA